jgi:hypothetical protein
MTETHFWIGVVSYEHVQRGVELGIAQLNHGKRDALARIHQGDWLINYSPRKSYPAGPPMQAFTAIGQITSAAPYQVVISEDFQPFRHTVQYLPCREVPIQEVLKDLAFLPDKQHWGARFRFGLLAVPCADFQQIAQAMGVTIANLGEGTNATLSF